MIANVKNIRSAEPRDAEQILNIYRYYVEKTAISFEEEIPTIEQMTDRIETTLVDYPWLVYQENDSVLV